MRKKSRISSGPVLGITIPHVFDIFILAAERSDLTVSRIDTDDRCTIFQCIDHATKNSELLHYFSHCTALDAGGIAFISIDMHSQRKIISDSDNGITED